MCKTCCTEYTQCGCFYYSLEPCPDSWRNVYGESQHFCRPVYEKCDECQKVIRDTLQPLLHKGKLAEIAEQHDQSGSLYNHVNFNNSLAALQDWLDHPEHPLPPLEKPDASSYIFLSPGFMHWADSGRSIEQCRKERQAIPPGPRLDFGQGFKITPPRESPPPPPESQPQTHTTTRRVCGRRVGEYDLTTRNTVLTQGQRDAMASAGHGKINRISVISRRELRVTRRSPLTAEQRSALRAGGHGNVSHIVTTRRRTPRDDNKSSSGETRHTLSARQRASLREAGHGNLRAIVVKGSHSKTPSNQTEAGSS